MPKNRVLSTVIFLFSLLTLVLAPVATAADGEVLSFQKISDTAGGFTGVLDDDDHFGFSAAPLGDLDGDGVSDIVIGTYGDDDGGPDRGAVWILFLNTDGTVKGHQKISDTEGNLTEPLDDSDRFGERVAKLGDLDGDGITDLAVGSVYDDDGGSNHGAVWILFLNTDGTVKDEQKISDTEGNFTGNLDDGDYFGQSITALDDLDGDGVIELAVGARRDDDGGVNRGAVWILFLNSDGTVKGHQKISDTEGNFLGVLDDDDRFGVSVASLGDLDGDSLTDLAVGADCDDDGGLDRGAVWVLFLNSDGTVRESQKINDLEGGFTGTLDDTDNFGNALGSVGDLDGDGLADLGCGVVHDDDGGLNRGAVWILYLNSDGTVKGHQKISDTEGGFTGLLDDGDYFGHSLALLGDADGDGVTGLAVGAFYDDDGGFERGAVWILFLDYGTTIWADMACVPSSGTLPMTTNMMVEMRNNYSGFARQISGRIDVELASGSFIFSWKAGYTTVQASQSYVTAWNQNLPNLSSLYGPNIFSVLAMDVTPFPYNQPPYPAAGDTATSVCIVTGVAP